jgi:DNA segregation ATPase FtsK/SpoIIIE-like protein
MVRTGLTVAANIATGLWTVATTAGAAAMALFASPVFLVVAGITALYLIFKKLGGDTQILSDIFSYTTLKFKDMFLALKEGLFSLLNKIPGMRGDFDKDLEEIKEERKQNAENREQLEQGIVKRAAENRAELDKKQTLEQAARHQRVDKKLLDQKESANAQQKAVLDAKRNLDDSETSLLVDEATRQKSAYIKDKPSTSVATAEATKASIVTEAEQKRAAAEAPAKKAEEEKKSEDSKKENEKGPAPSTQDSPATLLASLNTKMDQLIKHAAVTQSNTYETYRNTNGLSGNLYKSV